MKNLKKIVDFVSRQKRVKCQLKKRGIPLFFFSKMKRRNCDLWCTIFQVCIIFRLARRYLTNGLTNSLQTYLQLINKYSFFIRAFYKNILDRFWEKIKNFCKITFSPKVLKRQKCDIRTSYVTLEKLL